MDKFEYQAKLEEINKLIDKGELEEAVKIADTIEWKRVRVARTLCMISELYEAVGRVEDSKTILYRAYRRSPNSRQILYRLTEACLQTQDFDDAVEYYTEYVNLSPNDNSKYILKYEIYKERGSSLEEQIEVLEEYKSKEYTEKWAYELAKLYDQAGMAEHCVAECDDLALWFHNGKYVVQALELKQKYVPLSPEQQTVYDNPSEIVDMETKEEVVEKAVPTLDVEITKELPATEKDVIADSIIMSTEKEIAAAVAEHKEEPDTEKKVVKEPGQTPEVKDFDTVGLQSELANSMREILAGLRAAAPVEELESVPELKQPKLLAKEVMDAEVPPQVSEEVPVEKTDIDEVLTAATINLSERIREEIGDKNLREYAATQLQEDTQEAENIQSEKEPEEMTEEVEDEEFDEEPFDEEPFEEEEIEEEPQEEPVKFSPEDYIRNGLDDREKHMIGFWSRIRGMNEQIDGAVTQVMRSALTDKTSSTGNIVMVGDAGNGRTTLALGLAKVISRCKGLQSVKVAKIYAEDFNQKDIAATVNKVAGGMLIIEEAGDLDDNAIGQLSMAMDFKTDSLVVVLEDERRYLQDLLGRHPYFAQKFTVTLNVPTLTNDELVEFGKYYANEQDCALDDSAALALYDGIGAMQTPEQPIAILDVKEMVDKAIKNVNRIGLRKLFSTISGKRYDEENRIIIKGKNFKKVK